MNGNDPMDSNNQQPAVRQRSVEPMSPYEAYDPDRPAYRGRGGGGGGGSINFLSIAISVVVSLVLIYVASGMFAPKLSQYKSDITRLEMDLVNVRTTDAKLQEDLNKKQSVDLAPLNAQITQLNKDLDTLKTSLTTHSTQLTTLDTSVKAIPKVDLTDVNSKIAGLQSNLNTFQNSLTTLTSQVNNAKPVDLTAFNASITALQNSIAAINGKITALESSVATLNTNTNNAIASLDARLDKLEAPPPPPNEPSEDDLTISLRPFSGLDYIVQLKPGDDAAQSETIRLKITNNTTKNITDLRLSVTFTPGVPEVVPWKAGYPKLTATGLTWTKLSGIGLGMVFMNGLGLDIKPGETKQYTLTLQMQTAEDLTNDVYYETVCMVEDYELA